MSQIRNCKGVGFDYRVMYHKSEIPKVLVLEVFRFQNFGDYGFETRNVRAYGIDYTGILGVWVLKFGAFRGPRG